MVERVETQADETAWSHNFTAEDGDGGVAVAEGCEGEQLGKRGPGEGPDEVALEGRAIEGDVMVLDGGDVEGWGGRWRGIRSDGDRWWKGCGVRMGFGDVDVFGFGAEVDDGFDVKVGGEKGAVGESGGVGAR